MVERVDICCACGEELANDPYAFVVNFRYEVPGSGIGEQVLHVNVCDVCAKRADDPLLFPALECLILCRVIRMEHPDRVFTPEIRGDEK